MKRIILGFAAVTLLGAASAMAANDLYGSISYNYKTGRHGWALDYPSQSAASNRALKECGPGCVTVLEFQNTCAALALSPKGAYGWAGNEQMLEKVSKRALAFCQKHARGEVCRIIEAACTTRELDQGDRDESQDQ